MISSIPVNPVGRVASVFPHLANGFVSSFSVHLAPHLCGVADCLGLVSCCFCNMNSSDQSSVF